MKILNVFGFSSIFSILYINFDQLHHFNAEAFTFAEAFQAFTHDLDVVTRQCNNLENLSPLLRLKRHLFCDYDTTVPPNYPKTTDVSLSLIPKIINFNEELENSKLSLHSWIILAWTDPQLTWTPKDYDEITFIHVKSWQIWIPDLYINNSADMSNDKLRTTECLLFSSGSVSCVSATKFTSKCNSDFTYWPYDTHQCLITFLSWKHTGEEVDLILMDKRAISMSDYVNDTRWNFKFINSTKVIQKHECWPNDTSPRISYNFLLTRYHSNYAFVIVLPIVLMLLTLIVLCLDLKSVERIAIASVNFVCHLLCTYFLFWTLPFNGVNTPHILLFYRDSLALATFAIILTALLRKLEDMSTEIPNWISFTITFVLGNKVGRFLILKDNETKMTGKDIVIEENSDLSKSEINMKEPSWKYFAAIIDWLSFFCVILTYFIILITLVPI